MQKLIVSFTSYPARINSVKIVLDSLYAQTLQADEIILWLAEEEFPRKELDLPLSLQEDLQKHRYTVRWCDNLGSHKKYYYVMQENPEDLIVTVDDDLYYHPESLEKLIETYRRYPNAVVSLMTMMPQFDPMLRPLPIVQWLYDFQQIREPSMLLVPGSGSGTLFPPHAVNRKIFDKKYIKDICSFHGKIYGDDLLLKAGEMMNHTPVVCAAGKPYYRLPGTQKTALKYILPNEEHNNILIKKLSKVFGDAFDENDLERLKESLSAFSIADQRDGLLKKYWISRPIRELDRETGYLCLKNSIPMPDALTSEGINSVMSFASRVFRAYPPLEQNDETTAAVKAFIEQIKKVPGIESLSGQNTLLRGVLEYETLLNIDGLLVYRNIPIYMQSLLNWQTFLDAHPNCDLSYYEEFYLSMEIIRKSIKFSGNKLPKADTEAWKKTYDAALQKYAVYVSAYRKRKSILKDLRNVVRNIIRLY